MAKNHEMTAGEKAVAQYLAQAQHLEANGLYNPEQEHANCGVGMVASIDGTPRRDVVQAGIDALSVLFHRGAVDADGKTGDGAGIHVEIPKAFFEEHIAHTGHEPTGRSFAVGMVFLPRTDLAEQESCRAIVESEILSMGYGIFGWRQVPVNPACLGEKAQATRPEIEQVLIDNKKDVDEETFERELYIIRRKAEKAALRNNISGFYFASLSCRSIIYKGMFLAEELTTFYPDLLDERFESRFSIYHQRYSTNTFPTWSLAQPFRMLAHNGEINTLRGNVNWMKSHEIQMTHEAFGEYSDDLKPIIEKGNSDSAALDAVFEVMVRAGKSAPLTKTTLVPEAFSKISDVPANHRAMYQVTSAMMEPWDGPAALCATDGNWMVAGLDRNGLRPLRYTVTTDNVLIVGSETGMVRIPEDRVKEKGRVGPGQMIAVDLENGKFYHDRAIKDLLAGQKDYASFASKIVKLDKKLAENQELPVLEKDEMARRQVALGYTIEDLELILHPMGEDGKEAIGSMGDDTPLAVLSQRYRGLQHYFRQYFSQVTNPPIDPLREHRVMTLNTRFGNLVNVLDEDSIQDEVWVIQSPVLTNREFANLKAQMGATAQVIDCTFPTEGGANVLREEMDRIRKEAEEAVRAGVQHIILTDEAICTDRAAMPMILATGAVHTHLVNQGLRTFCSLNVRSAECMDTQYFAVLIGVGATTVNAYMAIDSLLQRHERGLFPGLSAEQVADNFKEAIGQGLLKIMSKMGISVVSSYRGGYNFEAMGLSRALVAEFFPGMTSRISGIGMTGIQHMALEQHKKGYYRGNAVLPIGGLYRFRQGGETHGFDGKLIHMLQEALATDSYALYKKYVKGIYDLPPIHLRDLLGFKAAGEEVSIDEVESITAIRKRFETPAMSLGALSSEAHETLAIAMNRIGAKSNSGEGGEGSERFRPRPNGDNACSTIKQVASGRFGVTAEYLNNAVEIQIKVAQGAKPGEGGQLPGFKVTTEIARLRNSTPGVTLISPPPHHDIYSIEDLAQLIYDLKQINPEAKVSVKLVAESGIGTIAAGVAKAEADIIHIAGGNGGTGASPQTSVKYAGGPWELGLAEVHQVLTLNGLRNRVTLRTDGGLKTGRDIVIAAMLGAEEFAMGTTSLVAMGCIMVRQCHSNTCPVGVCTQRPELRQKFDGTPEKVINLFTFVAEEIREILAGLGVRSLSEIIGRTDLLTQVSRGAAHLDDLDLNPLLAQADPGDNPRYCTREGRNPVVDTLDAQIVEDAQPVFESGVKMQLTYAVRNIQRSVGTRLSSHLVRKFGMKGLEPGHLHVRLRGSAGQALGAFAVQGLKLEVFGDANDYVGKGLSGGTIVVRTKPSTNLQSNLNAIIGNTVLYGATAGNLYAAGQAGERFCVRNSGAEAVVEGIGANGCEYMTGGLAVILGSVGENFGAGMTGGMAFIYDEDESFEGRYNPDSIVHQRVATSHWEGVLRTKIEEHVQETDSDFAKRLLENWDRELPKFWQIIPKEMLERMEHPLSDEAEAQSA